MTRLAEALDVDPPTDELVDAAGFEQMRARADELVPNSDTPIWRNATQFFDRARTGDWRDLVDERDLPRYDAAIRSLTDDDELIGWLHAGWLG
jgi:aryl sulfotransferase